ncbi:MAG: ABC transporter substrate-binding protein [Chloroflexota bacterium]
MTKPFIPAVAVLAVVLAACGGSAAPASVAAPSSAPAASPKPSSAAPAQTASGATAASAKPASSASVSASAAASVGQVTVRAGVLGIVPDAPIFIGIERGYYADQGIKVETTKFTTAGDMIAPLAAGQLEVGLGTPGAGLFNAITRDVPIRVVGDNSRVAPGKSHLALLKRKDNTSLNDYADLKGKKVSINAPAGGPEVELSRALAKGNLTFKDIDLKDVPFPDVNTALVNKSIDAGFNLEPFATLGIEKNDLAVFKYVGDFYPNDQVAVLLYSPKMVQNKDLATKFMIGYVKGLRDYYNAFFKNQDKAGVVQILAKDTAVKDPTLYDKMVSHVIDPNGGINLDSLTYDLNYFVESGSVKQKPDLKEVVDLSFVDAAGAKLGKAAA